MEQWHVGIVRGLGGKEVRPLVWQPHFIALFYAIDFQYVCLLFFRRTTLLEQVGSCTLTLLFTVYSDKMLYVWGDYLYCNKIIALLNIKLYEQNWRKNQPTCIMSASVGKPMQRYWPKGALYLWVSNIIGKQFNIILSVAMIKGGPWTHPVSIRSLDWHVV